MAKRRTTNTSKLISKGSLDWVSDGDNYEMWTPRIGGVCISQFLGDMIMLHARDPQSTGFKLCYDGGEIDQETEGMRWPTVEQAVDAASPVVVEFLMDQLVGKIESLQSDLDDAQKAMRLLKKWSP